MAKKVALAVEGSHKKRGDLEEEGEGIKGGGRAKIRVSQGRPSAKSREETPYARYELAYLETNLGIPNLFFVLFHLRLPKGDVLLIPHALIKWKT